MEEERAENVDGKNEKKIDGMSKKDRKNKESNRELDTPHSEKEDIRDHKKGRDKKKSKGGKNAVSDNIKGSRDGESTDMNGENGSEPALNSAERKRKISNAERKRKRREKDNNEKYESANTEEVEGNESKKLLEGESVSRESGKKATKEMKKQKHKLKTNHEDGKLQAGEKSGEVIGTHSENCKVDATVMVEKKKKRKDKKKNTGDGAIGPQDTHSEAKHDDGDVQSTKDGGYATERKKVKKPKKKENHKDDSSAAQQDSVGNGSSDLGKMQNNEIETANKKKKRKSKNVESGSDEKQDNEVEHANIGKKRKKRLVDDDPADSTPNKSNKKVRFSGDVEVFTLPDSSNTEEGNGEEDKMVRGKRFTSAEDEIVKQAVLNYIEEHELGDEGLDMVLNCSKHPNLKGCWKEIGSAIPYRPYLAIYNRARILFMRSENRKWTQEEYDAILKYHEAYGSKWKQLADELGKHTWHVKDTFRRIKLPNLKKGYWSQGEYQKLFDLVNTDLQLKVSEEKKSKHGMLRDNISWSAISDELSTRNQATCCAKWYKQLTSPMVAEGVWADSDDYRLLSALYSLDATCMEDVDWDDLIDTRSGDICRKRWNQMVLHIGHHGRKSFAEQVEILAHRYCPNLLEAREIWDSKPRVP